MIVPMKHNNCADNQNNSLNNFLNSSELSQLFTASNLLGPIYVLVLAPIYTKSLLQILKVIASLIEPMQKDDLYSNVG